MNKSESKYFNTAVRFDEALISLLEKKPFEYITIREICEKAEVNRSTFYLHYENMGDLLKETIDYVLNRFASYFPVDTRSVVARFADCELQDLKFINDKFLYPYLSFIRDNRRIFLAIVSQPEAFAANVIFQKMFDNIFAPILDRFQYPGEEQNYVMMFYLNGITAIIMEWVKDGCQKSDEDISDIIRHCIYGRE